MPGQAMAEVEDGGQRNLLHQQKVMDHGKHHHQIELPGEPRQ